MAMSSKVNNDLILTDPVVKSLFAGNLSVNVTKCETSSDDDDNDNDDDDGDTSVITKTEMKPVDLQSDQRVVNDNTPNTVQLIQEQKEDDTLASCWSLATKKWLLHQKRTTLPHR